MILFEEGVKPSFGGHEKFAFRNGWLKKGVDAVVENGEIFTSDEALVTLGVGKNMVRSIRHWCLATGLLIEAEGKGNAKALKPSPLAEWLMIKDQWDPYLEDLGSLWLIHWQLISNQKRTLVWSLAFSAFFDDEFSKKQLFNLVSKQLLQNGVKTTPGMVEREIDCLLRTYTPTSSKSGKAVEESLDCPLADLDLIRFIPDENLYRFNIGSKPSLPGAVFKYALIQYLSNVLKNRKTIAIEEILYQIGSPGQAFKLDENSLFEYLEEIENQTEGALKIDETTGLRQIYLNEDIIEQLSQQTYDILGNYYGNN